MRLPAREMAKALTPVARTPIESLPVGALIELEAPLVERQLHSPAQDRSPRILAYVWGNRGIIVV